MQIHTLGFDLFIVTSNSSHPKLLMLFNFIKNNLNCSLTILKIRIFHLKKNKSIKLLLQFIAITQKY